MAVISTIINIPAVIQKIYKSYPFKIGSNVVKQHVCYFSTVKIKTDKFQI